MTDAQSLARDRTPLLVLGVGNVLMRDEGVGIEVVRQLERLPLPTGTQCLDGGTGSLQLLDPLLAARRVVLIDATADGRPAGTLERLRPRFAQDFPRRLTAHDIGLKDLLDAAYLLGEAPDITLYAISIEFPQDLGVGLSARLGQRLPEIVARIHADLLEPQAAA